MINNLWQLLFWGAFGAMLVTMGYCLGYYEPGRKLARWQHDRKQRRS